MITTVAGTGEPGFSGDGGPATEARLAEGELAGLTVDRDGNIYFLTVEPTRIRRIDPEGTITSIGWSGRLRVPLSSERIWVDPEGNLYLAGDGRIEQLDKGGTVTTVAGGRAPGFYGDGYPATEAGLNEPGGMVLGPDGALFIGDTENARVRKVCL